MIVRAGIAGDHADADHEAASQPPDHRRRFVDGRRLTRVRTLPIAIDQHMLYSHHMLTIASRADVMNRLGRAMADPTRSRILLSLLERPGYPAQLARELELTRTNVSNHLACLRGCGIIVAEPEGRQTRYEIADPHLTATLTALVDVALAVDEGVPCLDAACPVPGCCDPAVARATE